MPKNVYCCAYNPNPYGYYGHATAPPPPPYLVPATPTSSSTENIGEIDTGNSLVTTVQQPNGTQLRTTASSSWHNPAYFSVPRTYPQAQQPAYTVGPQYQCLGAQPSACHVHVPTRRPSSCPPVHEAIRFEAVCDTEPSVGDCNKQVSKKIVNQTIINPPQGCHAQYHPQYSAPAPVAVESFLPPPQLSLYHTCALCGRVRSKAYHREHPILPGQPVITAVCRRCRSQYNFDSDGSPRKEKEVVRVKILKDGKWWKRGRSPKKEYRIIRRIRSASRERDPSPRESSRTRIIIHRTEEESPDCYEEIRDMIEEPEEEVIHYYAKPESRSWKYSSPIKYRHSERVTSLSPPGRRYTTRRYCSPSPVRLNTRYQYSPEKVRTTEVRVSRSKERGSPIRLRPLSPDETIKPRSILLSGSGRGHRFNLFGSKAHHRGPRVHFSDESSSSSTVTIKPNIKRRYKVVTDDPYSSRYHRETEEVDMISPPRYETSRRYLDREVEGKREKRGAFGYSYLGGRNSPPPPPPDRRYPAPYSPRRGRTQARMRSPVELRSPSPPVLKSKTSERVVSERGADGRPRKYLEVKETVTVPDGYAPRDGHAPRDGYKRTRSRERSIERVRWKDV